VNGGLAASPGTIPTKIWGEKGRESVNPGYAPYPQSAGIAKQTARQIEKSTELAKILARAPKP
jgi:hypothetical protein